MTWRCRSTLKMMNKMVKYKNGGWVYVKCIMDDAMGKALSQTLYFTRWRDVWYYPYRQVGTRVAQPTLHTSCLTCPTPYTSCLTLQMNVSISTCWLLQPVWGASATPSRILFCAAVLARPHTCTQCGVPCSPLVQYNSVVFLGPTWLRPCQARHR